MLKRNLIANYLGQGWTALMGLAFIPLYIQYLGIESYGLIGIFALLQGWLQLLDMGMAPTLSREMSRSTGGAHSPESIRDVLRSIELMSLLIAGLVVVGVGAGAVWLASHWLRVESLPLPVVAQAFTLMGIVTALRFIEGLYRSSLIGLQRQVNLNIISSVMATLRGLGALGILAWVDSSLNAFFIWQGSISLLTVGILNAATYRALPKAARSGRFSIAALRGIVRFAGGMLGITFLSLLLTQVDKIVLSKLLMLSDYGYYTLATVVAGSINQLGSPINNVWYPRLNELVTRQDQAGLIQTYHQGAQLISVVMGSAAFVIFGFAEIILELWTRDAELARHAAPLVQVLVLGNLFNGLMWMPYQTQLAHSWTSLTIRTNIIAVLIIVPAILWVTPRYGALGAAWLWTSLNAGYVLVSAHFMFRKILHGEKWRWYRQDVLPPLLAAVLAVASVRWGVDAHSSGLWLQGLILVSTTLLTFALAARFAPLVRARIKI